MKLTYTITYGSNYKVNGLKRRRTKAVGYYGNSVYKNINFIVEQLNKIVEEDKIYKEKQKKYCSELKSYYERIHAYVDISLYDITDDIYVFVITRDKDKNTTYQISIKDNNYYLKSKKIEYK